MLQLVGEEEMAEDRLQGYFEDLYSIVCISERPPSYEKPGGIVRSTYLLDWEQLVHLLEGYREFGEDIVEVRRLNEEEARLWRNSMGGRLRLARA